MYLLSALKYNLSYIKPSTWHYRLVKELFGEYHASKSKACTYYWLKLPSSLLVLGFLAVVVSILAVFTAVFGWLLGWDPMFRDPKEGEWDPYQAEKAEFKRTHLGEYRVRYLFYPYKRTRKGGYKKFAPWEILGLVLLLGGVSYGVYFLAFVWTDWLDAKVWTIVGMATLGAALLGVLTFWILKGRKSSKVERNQISKKPEAAAVGQSRFMYWLGKKQVVALYFVVFCALNGYLLVTEPERGFYNYLLFGMSLIFLCVWLTYLSWHLPVMKRQRAHIKDLYHRVCPTIVVETKDSGTGASLSS